MTVLLLSFQFGFFLFFFLNCYHQDFPGGSDGKEFTYNVGDRVWSLSWEDLLEESMAAYSSILAWKIPMGRGAWRATVRGVTKSQTHNWVTKHSTAHRTSKTILNKSGVSGYPCLVPDLRGNVFSLSPLSMMLVVSLWKNGLHYVEVCSLCARFLERFFVLFCF